VLVYGVGAIPGEEHGDALVQVVDHLRVPVEHHAEHGLGGRVDHLVRIAVDVDEGVVRPVGRRLARQRRLVGLALQVPVEPLDLLVAAVGIRGRIDEHDDVLADAADHRLLGHGEPIGELEHRLGGAALIRVEPGVEVVDRTGTRHELLGGRGIGAARIGERRGRGLEAVEVADAGLVRNREQHDVAAFLRAADGEETHPGRRGSERAAVGIGDGGIHELARGAGDAVQEAAR